MQSPTLALTNIKNEAQSALEKYGAFRSPHEFYGVLMEEVHEFMVAMHANDEDGARMEAMQIAAVAYRFYRDGWER